MINLENKKLKKPKKDTKIKNQKKEKPKTEMKWIMRDRTNINNPNFI